MDAMEGVAIETSGLGRKSKGGDAVTGSIGSFPADRTYASLRVKVITVQYATASLFGPLLRSISPVATFQRAVASQSYPLWCSNQTLCRFPIPPNPLPRSPIQPAVGFQLNLPLLFDQMRNSTVPPLALRSASFMPSVV